MRTHLYVLLLFAFPFPAMAEVKITIRATPKVTLDNQAQSEKKISTIPGNASLIKNDEWSNQRAATIKDITDYVPGIISQPRNGAESSRLSVRGSGLANIFQGRGLLVLQDGIPINTADGGFEFPVIDPWLIQRAEIYPGANALEYGASSFGGAINFITPNLATSSGYQFRSEAGSFGTLHGLISAGKEFETSDVFVATSGFSQKGFRDHNEQKTGRVNANLGWQQSDHVIHRFYVSHTESDAEIPGAISFAATRQNPKQASLSNVTGDYQRNLDISRIAHKAAWEEGDNRLDTTLFYTYRTLDNPVTTYEFETNHDFGFLAKFTHQDGLNQWLGGINTYYGMADESRYRNVRGSPGAHILERDLAALTTQAFGQYDQHIIGRLYGIIGAQGSYVTRDIKQEFPVSSRQDKDYAGFSPRAGLRYDLDKETQLFTNISRSFEPPTWGELSGGNDPGFNDLKAQRAITAEIGARGSQDGIHWQAAYYHGWLKNEFVNYRFADGFENTINAVKTKRDGVELGINGNAVQDILLSGDVVEIRGAYTYSRFTLDDDPLYSNNKLPGVPEHFIRAEALYHPPIGISIGPNIEISPTASPVDLANTLSTDEYAIYGARTFWESKDKRLNIYLEGRNLFDTTYIATSNVVPNAEGQDGRYFYPGEGRAIYAGLSWKL